jgi:hypothetical protein
LRVVEILKGREALGAQHSFVERVVRVSSNLCHPAIGDCGQNATPYLAYTTCCFYGITHEKGSFNYASLKQNIVSS